MIHYCRKCGKISQKKYGCKEQRCSCCDSLMYPVPEKYLLEGYTIALKNKETENILREELVKTSPEFDQYLFDHRDEILAKKSAELQAKLAHGKAVLEGRDKGNPYGVACPYCKATNVKKITNTSKAVHTALFGIFSVGRNSKQWHCTRCGSDF